MTFISNGIDEAKHAAHRLAMLVVVAFGFLAQPVAAQTEAPYPNKPVRIVVAFAPGGFADTITRLVGQKLSERLGQPVVVENRGGAGGNIGARQVAGAAPDGYTLLSHTAASAINVSLYKNTGFDLLTDLVPIANTWRIGHSIGSASPPRKRSSRFVSACGSTNNYCAAAWASSKPQKTSLARTGEPM